MNSYTAPTIVIAGPTASGKTNFSIKLAKLIDGEIINADAMQVYDGLNILKATPSKKEMSDVQHHLFGIIDCEKQFSVADWLKLAQEKIIDIHKRKKVPILVGGSGMYINAALNGISNIPKISPQVKMKVVNLLNEKGLDFIYEKLKLSHNKAIKIKKNDKQRLVRAYEVYLQTGKHIWWWQNRLIRIPIIRSSYKILILPSKETLYPHINTRLEKMINIGLLDEIREFHSQKLSLELPSMKAIGIKYFIQFLKNERKLDEAINLTKQESRRYAKRQMTWFRNSFSSDIIYSDLFKNDKKFILNAVKAFNLL